MVGFLAVLILALIITLAAAFVSAGVLGVGFLLSRVFPVSVFEGSIVVVAVGAVIVWLVSAPASIQEAEEEEEIGREEAVHARAWMDSLSLRPSRKSKTRRR